MWVCSELVEWLVQVQRQCVMLFGKLVGLVVVSVLSEFRLWMVNLGVYFEWVLMVVRLLWQFIWMMLVGICSVLIGVFFLCSYQDVFMVGCLVNGILVWGVWMVVCVVVELGLGRLMNMVLLQFDWVVSCCLLWCLILLVLIIFSGLLKFLFELVKICNIEILMVMV